MSEDKTYQRHELEEAVLGLLQTGGVALGNPISGLVKRYTQELQLADKSPQRRIAEVFWELQRRGLIYFSFADNLSGTSAAPAHWMVLLTDRGRKAASDELPNPDIPASYVERFVQDIPDVPPIVQRYVRESLDAYTQQLYMAAAVMLGVAAEAAFLDMAESFCVWLPENQGKKYRELLDNPRISYNKLLEGFRKRTEPWKKKLPGDLVDNLDVLNAILDLIRRYRNDAGHPTEVEMDRGSCSVSLVVFAQAARRAYALKRYFDTHPSEQDDGQPGV